MLPREIAERYQTELQNDSEMSAKLEAALKVLGVENDESLLDMDHFSLATHLYLVATHHDLKADGFLDLCEELATYFPLDMKNLTEVALFKLLTEVNVITMEASVALFDNEFEEMDLGADVPVLQLDRNGLIDLTKPKICWDEQGTVYVNQEPPAKTQQPVDQNALAKFSAFLKILQHQELTAKEQYDQSLNKLKTVASKRSAKDKALLMNLAREVLRAQLMLDNDASADAEDYLPKLSACLNSATALLESKKIDNELLQAHQQATAEIMGLNKNVGKMVGASMLLLLGTALIASGITLAMTTAGVATPLTMIVHTLGSSLIAEGIAAGSLSAGLISLIPSVGLFKDGVRGNCARAMMDVSAEAVKMQQGR